MARSRRVCLLMETYWPQVGGGESAGRLLAHGLIERGHEVAVVTRRSVPGAPERERDGDVDVRRLPPGGAGPGRKWMLTVPALAHMLAAGSEFDILVALGFRVLGAPAVMAGGLLGLPVVLKAESRGEMSGEFFRAGLEARGVSPEAPAVRAFIAARNRVLRRAEAWVAMTGELETELSSAGVMPERIHRIPNAVDMRHFVPPADERRSQVRRDLSVPDGAPLLVYTGRLVAYKGLPGLVEIWPRVLESHPDARLALVGEGGGDPAACEDELRRRVVELDIADSVWFPGPVDDVLPWLHAADGFVFPTREEAFGLSVVEAMACGLPIVTTRVGGLADIVSAGEDALVVDPGDDSALLAGLGRLADGGTDTQAMGRRARATAEARYARDPVLDAWSRLIERTARFR